MITTEADAILYKAHRIRCPPAGFHVQTVGFRPVL